MEFFTNLPSDLTHHIINNVDQDINFVDKVQIRTVCSSWNSLLPTIPKLRSKNLPWILQQDNTKGASIYTPHDHQTYFLDLPEIKNKIFKGSSYGWIATVDDINGGIDDIYLFNPLTRAQIQLPPRSTFPDVRDYYPDRVGREYVLKNTEWYYDDGTNDGYIVSKGFANQTYIHKILLSSSPISDDCMAVAIFGEFGQLTWCRMNDKKWMPFIEYSSQPLQDGFYDAIFYNSKLHALHVSGKLAVYDTIDPDVSFTLLPKSPVVRMITPSYLVECSKLGVLLVARHIQHINEEDKESRLLTTYFCLYKLVDSTKNNGSKVWVEIENIGDNILFLGINSSWSIPISDELKSLGYKRNCIYYADESRDFCDISLGEEQRDTDIGIYNLEDKTTEELSGFDCQFKLFWPPPVWVTPNAS